MDANVESQIYYFSELAGLIWTIPSKKSAQFAEIHLWDVKT